MNEQLNQFHMMNQPQAMMNRSYGLWPQQNPSQILRNPNFNLPNQSMAVRNNWKGKNKVPDNRKSGGVGYKPPTLQELQSQNRLKARRFYHPKKKFNNRSAPYAPRNTTSFIIRAKKAGGIASLVSPCPVTPAVLPTPVLSPSTEVLGDMAKEEWGVDGYGTMNGLIRLRDEAEVNEEEEEEGGGSSDSDVEEHVEVERRLDQDLSRFEMIYPNSSGLDYNNVLENRADDRDAHILQLEEENLTLKEKLFLMGREMEDLKRRLLRLERRNQGLEDANEEVVENESESESGERGDRDDNATMRENNDVNNKDVVNNENVVNNKDAVRVNNGEVNNEDVVQMKEDNNNEAADSSDVQMEELASVKNEVITEEDRVQG
ncbi:hypothetical protein PVL29_007117 [Vitis rotundifolia]|uniref:PRLI-interacting factor A n=1 Tax=Vitis rotundifolia TaxID=103349 RepID=A0AA39DUW5_VITRO|nr:hypothetical protein PVL29_007117 [Vitis rotundifolia]